MEFTVNGKKFEHVVFITRDGCEATAVIRSGMSHLLQRPMRQPAPIYDPDIVSADNTATHQMRTYERTGERRPGGVVVFREVAQTDSGIASSAMRQLSDEERLHVMDAFCKHCGADDPRCCCWRDD